MKRSLLLIALLAAACLMTFGCNLFSSPTDRLSDSHIRIVWVQDQGHGADTAAGGQELKLMGYDSQNRGRERVILGEERNYFKPMMTPDGSQVVFSDRTKRKVYVVDWSGKNKQPLGPGVAMEVWQDPGTGTVWVYAEDGPDQGEPKRTKNRLYRFPLNDPSQRELVWDNTHLSWSNFQLSADGKRAGGMFPWPKGGVVNFDTGEVERFGHGCWASFSPDNQYLLWLFDGQHRNLTLYHPDGTSRNRVNINQAEGIKGYEVYHPRWSNHPRYLVMTGPYKEGEGGNRIRGGGDEVEVYAGRFSENLDKVDLWVKVTDNKKGDFYPDLWIDEHFEADGGVAARDPAPLREAKQSKAALKVEAVCTQTYSLPDPSNIGMYSRAFGVHHYTVKKVEEGTLDDKTILVAQWLIKDRKLVQPEIVVGKTYSLVLEDYYDHPELEGERLLMGPEVDPEEDIYIDASQLTP